jgi:hypothetical protein
MELALHPPQQNAGSLSSGAGGAGGSAAVPANGCGSFLCVRISEPDGPEEMCGITLEPIATYELEHAPGIMSCCIIIILYATS